MITVRTQALAGLASRVASTDAALQGVGRPLGACRAAAVDTAAATAHAAAVEGWTAALEEHGAATRDLALALIGAMRCYEAADVLPARGG